MDVTHQRTLRNRISCTGIGLHSGLPVAMTLHPALPDTGIIFRRTDVAESESLVRANRESLSGSKLCTTVANEFGTSVATIEHLMAALAGCAVDNVLIELDGAEVPIMDGSAEPFVLLLENAGMIEQDAPRQVVRVLKRIEVTDGVSSMVIEPNADFVIDFEINFENTMVSRQRRSYRDQDASFKDDIGKARTFGFAEDADALRSAGLALGGSLDNAVVVDGAEILNVGGLRYDDEFVRHKVLDCIGDMYLAGGPLMGKITAIRSGHALNHQLLVALFADPDAWVTVDAMPSVSDPQAAPEILAAASA
ncbi:MAG: UDP-3-O-acyl-N-acetylglucosamine deacetylase [Alphaproteobacteria bacterium]|jgi:UDP-3-O-[3-hydroxymyristoyl] N-acetylglucosamine deacetylase|nr:UDP-3-O-acyl-N-acetylglucosamine deacetylase [Alphaproteobacteria bacterium]MBT4711075.1 UDP-3-O-acyl-N-acetylglucosamine deacetylase [Alphaproteobacteria bacterium]MBT5860710.1 UDP-3-O-acyl-N-acetylglucosamine deacetylase [Alphaproteobacteria bacterium]